MKREREGGGGRHTQDKTHPGKGEENIMVTSTYGISVQEAPATCYPPYHLCFLFLFYSSSFLPPFLLSSDDLALCLVVKPKVGQPP